MLNKYFSLKLLFFFCILITVFGDMDDTVEQPSESKESVSGEEENTTEEMALLLPNKKPAQFPNIIPNGFLPSKAKSNSSGRIFADKQINEKHPRTRVISHIEVDAIYNCTPDSVLSVLVLHSELDNYFTCYQVVDIPHENRLNATFKRPSRRSNEPMMTFIGTKSAVNMVFFKGNHMYYSTGRVEGGLCSGDILTIMNVSLVKKGSCNLRSGVQQIVSDYALLNLTGKCQSTCFGDVNVSVSPGLRN